VNELFRSVNVAQELKSGLPTQLQGLAGPAAAGLRTLAERAVPTLLATSAVQESWRRANRVAHAQLIQILNGGSKTVSTKSGEVSLNLHELVNQLASQLGVLSQVEAARSKLQGSGGTKAREVAQEKLGVTLPSTSGQLVLMRSSQLKAAQEIVKAVRHLALVLPLLAIALFALAIWLDKGRRRKTLRTTGWCFFGIGVLLLLGRRAGGDAIVNSLVKVPANKPAVHEVWSIGTQLLYDIAIAMVLYGLALVASAWLAGSTRPATGLRRAMAPWLREHAVASYLVAEAILLLIVLWGPTPATREWLPVIGFAILFAFGMSLLRAQTGREFPDAKPGEATARLRAWYAETRARRHAPAVASSSDAGNGSPVEALERLAALHERGALTDEEFAAEKRRLLPAAH
jgi:Short C-terminal domain